MGTAISKTLCGMLGVGVGGPGKDARDSVLAFVGCFTSLGLWF